MSIVDVTCDPGFSRLQHIVREHPELAGVCKTAQLDRDVFENLPDASFAWPEERKFPIHTKEHAALSVGYAKYAEQVPAYVLKNLDWAKEAYALSDDLYHTNGSIKQAGVRYLQEERQRFRVASPRDVKLAEAALLDRRREFAPVERTHVFSNLVKAAQDYGVELEPRSLQLGGATVTDVQNLKDWLDVRANKAEKVASPLGEVYREMADSFGATEGYIDKPQLQQKLAVVIEGLDKRAGLSGEYSKAFPDPVLSVYNTEKVAEATVNVAGVPIPEARLSAIPLTFWKDVLGDDIAQEIAPAGSVDVETLKQVIETLPADIKAVAARQLRAYS